LTDFGGALVKADTYDFAVLGIPFDQKSSYLQGAAEGPDALRKASTGDAINSFTETGWDLREDALLVDKGNLFLEGLDPHAVFIKIEQAVDQILAEKGFPVIMGGDHSITYPVIKSVKKHYAPLDILHFDAHPDLYESFEGDRYSHACPFARILEDGGIHELIQVGLRAETREQRERAKKYRVKMFPMRELGEIPRLEFTRPLYISFDMDALDPAYAPGVSHHEPGGLSTRQVLHFLHNLKAEIIGMDCVELNPSRDLAGITAAAGVKIMMEVMGAALENRAG
jgi:arginase